MEHILNEKIKVGIAACQYGGKVRYNGKGYEMLGYIGRDRGNFIWTPVCPEVMSGMGIPRNPIRLSGGNGFDVWDGKAKVKNREGKDVTDILLKGSSACFETLERSGVDAYIFMEGSPSCGVYRTSLKNKRLGNPPGVFGALLLNKGLFLIPSSDLQSPVKWWDWKRRLMAFIWVKKIEIASMEVLYEVWHILKFLCHELDGSIAGEIGKKIGQTKEFSSDKIEAIRSDIMDLLRRPSDIEKIKKWLWTNYCHLKSHEGIEVPSVNPPEALRSITHIAEEMLAVEIKIRNTPLIFGSAPITYTSSR